MTTTIPYLLRHGTGSASPFGPAISKLSGFTASCAGFGGRSLAVIVFVTLVVLGGEAGAESLTPGPEWHPTVDVDVLSGGQRQRVLTLYPQHIRGTLVMLPGGAGTVGLEPDGTIARADNVVIRTTPLWLKRGFAVVIPDALDRRDLRGSRAGPEVAAAVLDLVDKAHRLAPGPVFLVGTSQGAIAAVNGAAQLPEDQLAGLVLLEAVSRLGGSHETIFESRPERVKVPVLVVANTADRCRVSPPAAAERIKEAFTAAPKVDVVRLSGGGGGGGDCSSHSPHGLLGLEAETVRTIADWMPR